jgi:YggT family protein
VPISIGAILANLFNIWSMLVLLWCLLSWFPNIDREKQPFRTLDMLVQPVMLPFRRFIPPIGGIDLSPMVAIILLQFLMKLVIQVLP